MKQDRKLLYRLMKKQDGSFKVVGYEKREGSNILHAKHSCLEKLNRPENLVWAYIILNGCITEHYLHHDRLDQYTNIDVGGQMLFERDKMRSKVYDRLDEPVEGIVAWDSRSFCWQIENAGMLCNLLDNFYITGIEGVK